MGKVRLFWKLYPSYLLITVLSLLVAGWFMAGTLREFHVDQVADDLEAKARLISRQIVDQEGRLMDARQIDRYCKQTGRMIATRVTVILPGGRVIGDSHKDPGKMDNHGDRPEVRQALSGRQGSSIRHSHTLGTDMMYMALPVRSGQKTCAVVRTAMPLRAINHALAKIRAKILTGSLVAALLAGVLCFLISRRISRPLEELTAGVQSFPDQDLGRRQLVPDSAPREFHMLEQAMGRMAAELDKRMETLVKQRNQLEAILSSMSEGVIAVDQDRCLVIVNESAAGLLDLNREAVHGLAIQETIRNPALQELVARVLTAGKPERRELQLRQKGLTVLQANGVPLRSAGRGRMIGALVVLTDVTRLRQVERVRKDFVANVSHELKTPITAIKGFAETLLDGTVHDSGDIARFLGIIASHADRMEKIVQDLLTLSRLERHGEKESIEFEPVRLDGLVEKAVQACGLNAQQKKIQVATRVEPDLVVRGSAHLLEQALVNLVDNAIKYSEDGSRVQIEAGAEAGRARIAVRDQGCGIAACHLDRIFERFYRVDKARSRKLGGTGLGLAIVKHVAQIHGGQVEVESTAGKGSVFSILLPLYW